MQKFDATLPATRCTSEMREDVTEVAQAAGLDKADVIRDALEAFLPQAKLALGLIEPELPAGFTVESAPAPAAPAGCWGADTPAR